MTAQPLGIAAGPAGALLLPPPVDDAALARVLLGDTAGLPPHWAFYAHAVAGDRDAALAALGDDAAAPYNRFVLTGNADRYAVAAAALNGDARTLLDAAAYAHGLIDTPPEPPADVETAAAAILGAYLLLVRLDAGETVDAAQLSAAAGGAAAHSPALAARLHVHAAARLEADGGAVDDMLAALDRARALFGDGAFAADAAECALRYGLLAQEHADGRRALLLAAVHAYQRALLVFTADGSYRTQFALAHMNLGLAYLALPMNDEAERLRPAIAMQSLRQAAAALDARRSPDLWAGATLNLANALQHVRSTHQEDNLWEAVALYEDVLPVVAGDPIRKARVLANEGNALAHLGAFSRAVPRLNEARAIFALHGDTEATAAIDGTLAEIASRAAAAGSPHGTA